MSRLVAFGLSVQPPSGWEGEIYRRAPEGATIASVAAPSPPTPIVHMANFALPTERGDYGGGAVELMGSGGIFISLLEHDPAEAAMELFASRGTPWPLVPSDFHPQQMQRPIAGQAGCQRFFSVAGRAFCLYVALGSYRARELLVREVNAALASMEIAELAT